MGIQGTVAERFWRKVIKPGNTRCWPWVGYVSPAGYGQFAAHFGEPKRGAHRWSYALTHGVPVDTLRVVMHLCDNPLCCNPAHLRDGTHSDNHADMVLKGRHKVPVLPRGEQHPRAKLSDAQVQQLRKLLAAGETQASVAKKYCVSPQLISAISTGKLRKWSSRDLGA